MQVDTFMIWYDEKAQPGDDPQASLKANVEQAGRYFQAKYGQKPAVCLVYADHPAVAQGQARVGGVLVCGRKGVQKNEYWMGVE